MLGQQNLKSNVSLDFISTKFICNFLIILRKIFKYLFIILFFCNISFADNLDTQLQVLKKLFDDGLINQEEFKKAKSILLDKSEVLKEKGESLIDEKSKIKTTIKSTGKQSWEKAEIIFKDYRIYTHRPGGIKIKRVSDGKQLLVISGNLKYKYSNNSEDLFDIEVTRKARPSAEEDILNQIDQLKKETKKTVEGVKKLIKDPAGTLKNIIKNRKISGKKELSGKDDIKLILKIDDVKILHFEGRYVGKYHAYFYQVLTSGYTPFHYYIHLANGKDVALNMESFNKKIDRAVRKAKERLSKEHNITMAQIDEIIERQTGEATEKATQEAIQDAIANEVEAAIAQSMGEAISESFIDAIEKATGEAISAAVEAELAAAIDAEIQRAVEMGIEQAAVAAGWQAYFDTIAAGGTEAEAVDAAYEACGGPCEGK